jgi:multimeric flavodoxin WrbA
MGYTYNYDTCKYPPMAPQIIALMGSPRPKGNTGRLLAEAVRGAQDAGCEVEVVDVPHMKFKPCMEILYCQDHEACGLQDDVTPYLEKFKAVDGMIIATPVMTMGVPGALKSFMDRFQVYFMAKYFRKDPLPDPAKKRHRRALLISIGGQNIEHDFDGLRTTVQCFCDILDIKYWGEVLQNNMDEIIDITTRPEVMRDAYTKSYEMCTLIKNAMEK